MISPFTQIVFMWLLLLRLLLLYRLRCCCCCCWYWKFLGKLLLLLLLLEYPPYMEDNPIRPPLTMEEEEEEKELPPCPRMLPMPTILFRSRFSKSSAVLGLQCFPRTAASLSEATVSEAVATMGAGSAGHVELDDETNEAGGCSASSLARY